MSPLIAGAVDYREALFRVGVPFGALVLAYKYTQKQTSVGTRPAPVTSIPRKRPAVMPVTISRNEP